MADKARRPYLNLDDYESRKPGTPQSPLEETSVVRMSSRYLATSLSKESEFEKPYLGTSPRKMHFDPFTPDWPDIPYIPGWPGPPIVNPPGGPGCSHCALAFDSIYNCEEDWGEAHAMIYCSFNPGTDCPDCTMQIRALVGAIVDIQPGTWSRRLAPLVWKPVQGSNDPFGYGGPSGKEKLPSTAGTMSLKVKVDPTIGQHVLRAEMIDGAGNYCEAYLDVTCCDCAKNIVALTGDTTIDPGGNAFVTASGGCEPYKFSVSGLGYTVAGSGVVGTVTSASGTCGTNYGASCVVTVTDVCKRTATWTIRNTGGTWVGHGGCVATCTGGSSCIDSGSCWFTGTKSYSYGLDQWVYGPNFNCRLAGSSCTWTSGGSPCTEPNPSICANPIECATYFTVGPCTCTGTPGLCYLGTLTHNVWACA